jgi:hypothetical protein
MSAMSVEPVAVADHAAPAACTVDTPVKRGPLSTTVIRRLCCLLHWLAAPTAWRWTVPLLLVGVLLVIIGWLLSFPVVLPGDGTYALERTLALSAHTLTGTKLPSDAPTAAPLVQYGVLLVLLTLAFGVLALALKLTRVRVNRYLVRGARELALLYADSESGPHLAQLSQATPVRLDPAVANYSGDAPIVLPLDEAFLTQTLPSCASAVRELLALGHDSERNLQLARALVAPRAAAQQGPMHRLCIRIDQRQLRSALGHDDFGGLVTQAEELRLISLPSARCRRLLRDQPPIKVHTLGRGGQPALIVIGLGDTGFELICKLLSQAQSPNLDPLIVVLVDANAAAVEHTLRALSPELEQVVSFVALALESRLPESAPHLLSSLAQRELTATCIYLASDESALVEGWHRELELAYRMVGAGCPLILRVRFPTESSREQSLLEEDAALDAAPRAIHERYLEHWRGSGQPGGITTVPWEALPFEYQEDNRAAADHYWVKARELDLLISQSPSHYQPVLPTALVDTLARAEHRRWMASRAVSGWRLGARRDDAARVHPSMRPWETLDESEREKDREVVRSTASALASAGYHLRPLVRFSWPLRDRTALEAGARAQLLASAVDEAQTRAAVANVAICVEDAASFQCAQALVQHPGLTVSLVAARALAGFAVTAGDSTLTAQRLAEHVWEVWDVPEQQIGPLMARWPRLGER